MKSRRSSLIAEFKKKLGTKQEDTCCVSFSSKAEDVFRLVGFLDARQNTLSRYVHSGLLGGMLSPSSEWRQWVGSEEAEAFIEAHKKEDLIVTLRLPVSLAVALRKKSEKNHISQSSLIRGMIGLE